MNLLEIRLDRPGRRARVAPRRASANRAGPKRPGAQTAGRRDPAGPPGHRAVAERGAGIGSAQGRARADRRRDRPQRPQPVDHRVPAGQGRGQRRRDRHGAGRRPSQPVDHARGREPGACPQREGHRRLHPEEPAAELRLHLRRRRPRRHAAGDSHGAQPGGGVGRGSREDRRGRLLGRRRTGGARRAAERRRQAGCGRSGRARQLTARLPGARLSRGRAT